MRELCACHRPRLMCFQLHAYVHNLPNNIRAHTRAHVRAGNARDTPNTQRQDVSYLRQTGRRQRHSVVSCSAPGPTILYTLTRSVHKRAQSCLPSPIHSSCRSPTNATVPRTRKVPRFYNFYPTNERRPSSKMEETREKKGQLEIKTSASDQYAPATTSVFLSFCLNGGVIGQCARARVRRIRRPFLYVIHT